MNIDAFFAGVAAGGFTVFVLVPAIIALALDLPLGIVYRAIFWKD